MICLHPRKLGDGGFTTQLLAVSVLIPSERNFTSRVCCSYCLRIVIQVSLCNSSLDCDFSASFRYAVVQLSQTRLHRTTHHRSSATGSGLSLDLDSASSAG